MDSPISDYMLEYKITKSDYLSHLLYSASHSKMLQKGRWKTRVRVPIVYILGSFILWYLHLTGLAILFFIFGTLWYFIYPLWSKRYYIKYYQEVINENNKGNDDRPVLVRLNNEYIFTNAEAGEMKIKTKEINEIIELSDLILLKMKNSSIIIPKKQISDLPALAGWLKQFSIELGINYKNDEKWVFK
jgi:hypothetical protein